MHRDKVFKRWALSAIMGLAVQSLLGCDTERTDDTIPDHSINLPLSQGKYRFGSADTIKVSFSEAIDTAALSVEITPAKVVARRFVGRTRLELFGGKDYFGTPYFGPGDTGFTLALMGLKDMQGNTAPRVEAAFRRHLWVDWDFQDSTFDSFEALYGTDSTWIDGTPVTDSLVIEGILEFKKNFGWIDRLDYKTLRIAAPDTVLVSLTTRKDLDLKLQIAGPFGPTGLDSLLQRYNFDSAFFPKTGETGSTEKRGSVSARFNADLLTHKRLFGDYEAPGIYVLRIGIPQDFRGFYRLQVKVLKFKLL